MSSTNQTLSVLVLNNFVNYIDFAVRAYSLLVHVIYFTYVLVKKDSELRQRTYFILHNVNVTTLSISLVYTAFIPYSAPSFESKLANQILCRLTEMFWLWTKYARVYALVLLAFYRYTACIKIRWYQFINRSLVNMFGIIFFTWVISLGIPVITKFALSTTYSLYFCTDGFSVGRINNSIAYYVFNTTVGSILPTIFICFIYLKVYEKLKSQAIKTGAHNTNSAKLGNFSKQFIVLNVITSISTIFSTFIDYVNVIAVSDKIIK